jgi:hypothetical protein
MKRIVFILAAPLLLCSLLSFAQSKDALPVTLPITYNFATINYPSSTYTELNAINDSTYIAGYHGFNPQFGFTLISSLACPPTCRFKPENYPGSISTEVFGINNDNNPNFETAGVWLDKTGIYHGFMHNAEAWTDVDYPGTTNNYLYGLNDNDVASGFYEGADGKNHAYIYSQPGNQFIPLSIPGDDSAWAADINDYNVIVGTYFDSSNTAHGFEISGLTFTALNFPSATATYATGINNAGAIVGFFYNGDWHGFLYYGGSWQQLDDPDAVGETYVYGINDSFDIVGTGHVTGRSNFGFEATP